MLRFLADENLNDRIVRGLLRRRPKVDILRARQANLLGADDAAVLIWSAEHQRILITHDVTTITRHAYDRVRAGQAMPGVFEVPLELSVGRAIEDLLLLAEASLDDEWEGQVRYLPLQ